MMETTDHKKRKAKSRVFAPFLPSYRTEKLTKVDWTAFARSGIRLIAVDLDNTLAEHGSALPDTYANSIVSAMQAAGIHVMLYSNASHQRDVGFATALGVDVVANVAKPNPEALDNAMKIKGVEAAETLVVGDQLITDVWSANRLNVPSLWVKKRDKNELVTIRLKRLVEAIIVKLNRQYFASLSAVPPSFRLHTGANAVN